jgi:hypothetical protein
MNADPRRRYSLLYRQGAPVDESLLIVLVFKRLLYQGGIQWLFLQRLYCF